MDPLLIFLGIIAIVICAGIAIWKSNRYDALKTDVDILRRRNETLEEKFQHWESRDLLPEAPQQVKTAAETLKCFAQENGCKLECRENDDESWEEYVMRYQGGNYQIYVRSCEMLIRFHRFAEIESNPDTYTEALALCLRFNEAYCYFKLTFDYFEEQQIFGMAMYIDLLNPSTEWLESVLSANWSAVDVVRREIAQIRKKCGLDNVQLSETNPQSEAEDKETSMPDTAN